jgi:hypothetical protein
VVRKPSPPPAAAGKPRAARNRPVQDEPLYDEKNLRLIAR